ncbi:hypothetical protein X777_07713, partial [Ooceraea biroi]
YSFVLAFSDYHLFRLVQHSSAGVLCFRDVAQIQNGSMILSPSNRYLFFHGEIQNILER